MAARQLFGTDGIRGVAGQFPLTPATIYSTGLALGKMTARLDSRPLVVLGMDTRESSPWIAQQIAGGLKGSGARPVFAGVITTPGIAYLTRTNSFVAGVMISASHNPYQDNGIKVFGHTGYKLPDKREHELESEIFALLDSRQEEAPAVLEADPELSGNYLDFLISTFAGSLGGVRMVVDCGNGAAYRLAPQLFRRLGAHVEVVADSPDGRNINLNCGALHVETLCTAVTKLGADLGVALDGDGDRAIFVSSSGKVVDGDGVMLLAARFLLERGQLSGAGGQPIVVATVMSNLGLEKALSRYGIRMLRAPVGDKYVLEEMLRTGAVLGGEQSGHIIFHNYATTGDGLLTTLRVLEAMQARAATLDELAAELERYPQRLLNVRVTAKPPIDELPEVGTEIRAAERAFGDSGRILVRYSGTELLARIMVEGSDGRLVDEHASRIAGAVRRAIGAGAG